MALNGTSAAGAISGAPTWFPSWLLGNPDGFYDITELVAAHIGEAPTYVLFTYGILKIELILATLAFLWIERNRWFEQYKIQKNVYIPEAQVQEMWERTHGLKSIPGLFMVALPMSLSDYWIQKHFGMNMHDRSSGWRDFAWRLPIAIFWWDLIIWLGHVLQHTVPVLYKRYHKWHHHENRVVNILAASQFTLVDAILETTYPVYLGCAFAGMSFFGCFFFQCVFLAWVGIHNHAGYAFPWDFLNFVFRYVDWHDMHHEAQHKGFYQTFYWGYLDRLFGWCDVLPYQQAQQAVGKKSE
ncbi:hypothetical protein DFJ74DRAFT_314144 [Hyaloraphidium curvatum]|nr:hypothetical protein DFJ74DRAFT_314144 [Hyaloraphidium curvatum]